MPEKVDPEKAQCQYAIAEAVIMAEPATAVLYADESARADPAVDFIAFLERLLAVYANRPIVLIVDNYM